MDAGTHQLRLEAGMKTVEVWCDHSGQGRRLPDIPRRLVSTVAYVPKPDPEAGKERIGWLEWRELVQSDPEQTPALQTPFGELGRRRQEIGFPVDMGGLAGLPAGMDYAHRWRFHCRDCEDTLEVRGEKLEAIFGPLAERSISFITLAPLRALVDRP